MNHVMDAMMEPYWARQDEDFWYFTYRSRMFGDLFLRLNVRTGEEYGHWPDAKKNCGLEDSEVYKRDRLKSRALSNARNHISRTSASQNQKAADSHSAKLLRKSPKEKTDAKRYPVRADRFLHTVVGGQGRGVFAAAQERQVAEVTSSGRRPRAEAAE